MAFPTIPTAAAGRVLSQLATNPAGTHTSPSLSSLTKNAGDLLIAIVIIYDGNSTNAEFSSWGGGFTEFVDQATTATMGIGCAYKWSTGSETGTFTVTSADTSANDSCFFLISIPGAHAVTPPEGGTIANGTSAAADPGSLNPAGWGTEDTLWIAVGGSGETATTGSYTGIASAPANYTDYVDSGISADVVGGVEGALAFRQLNAASEDVGGFSVDTSNARNSALLIAVRPALAPVSVGLVTETDSVFAVGRIKSLAIGLVSEADSAFDVTADIGSGQEVEVGLVTETDSAFSVGRRKDLAAGLVTETDSPLAVGRLKSLTVGLVVETDSGLAVTLFVPQEFDPNCWYEGKTIHVLSDVTGLQEWVDYVPVEAAPGNPGRFDNDGSFPVVQVVTNTDGLTPWVDYLPVYVVSRTRPWSTDEDGYVPFETTS